MRPYYTDCKGSTWGYIWGQLYGLYVNPRKHDIISFFKHLDRYVRKNIPLEGIGHKLGTTYMYMYLCPAHSKVMKPFEARKIVSPFRNTPDTILYVCVTHVHTN